MNNHASDVDVLVLDVLSSGGIGELKGFFDGRKDGRDQFVRMITRLLDDFLVFK